MEIASIAFTILFWISWLWLWYNWRKEMKRRHYLELKLMECRQQQQKG